MPRALVRLCLVVALPLAAGCGLETDALLPDPASPALEQRPNPQQLRTLPPLPTLDPALVVAEAEADGWRELPIAAAELRMLLPQGWAAVNGADLPDIGDFDRVPVGSFARDRLEGERGRLEDDELIMMAVELPAPPDGAHETVIHLTPWAFWSGQPLDELMPILARDRVGPAGWYESATVTLGVGEARRIHWWEARADVADAFDYLEYLFMAPNGRPYTLSFLLSGERVDEQWPLVERIAVSVRPLD
jgi:hypothetical protein